MLFFKSFYSRSLSLNCAVEITKDYRRIKRLMRRPCLKGTKYMTSDSGPTQDGEWDVDHRSSLVGASETAT